MIEALGGEVFVIQKGCCGMVALERGLESYAKNHYQRPLLKRFQKAYEAGAKKVLLLEPTCLFALRSFPEELKAFGFHKEDLEFAPDFISYALPQTAPTKKPQSGAVYQPPCSHDSSIAKPWLEKAFAPCSVQALEGVCCGMQGSLGFRASARSSRERFINRFAQGLRRYQKALWIHDCSLCLMLARSLGTQKSLSRIDGLWELHF
jgi:Fe-S oxidoreductase